MAFYDIFGNKLESGQWINELPSAVIPVVNTGVLNAYNCYDYTIDYTVGSELYLVYTEVSSGKLHPYEIKTADMVNYKRGGGTVSGYWMNNGYTKAVWTYPDMKNANTYPWTTCLKLDTAMVLDTFYNTNGLTGTRKLDITVSNSNCVLYDGTNADTANCWILNRESSISEWLNKFPEVEEVSDSFAKGSRLALKDTLGIYNVLDYGINTESEDNTLALQTLVDEVNRVGGGTIFFPVGTYLFNTASEHLSYQSGASGSKCCVKAKSYVSIIGESLTETVLKLTGNSQYGVAMFAFKDKDNPLTGCTYSNFTVDASETTINTYSSDGKAFFYQYVKDCVFRDLRLIGTPATAMGNDFLDNVVMDSIYVYNAGRIHAEGGAGGAGIGIGTGGFENENFIVRNCICDSCGHFGIFCEDQALFSVGTPVLKYPKGMIIANNIVRNGRNYGIGLRGGKYATVVGNNVYSNLNGGIYLDFGADSSAVMNNLISDEVNAICFGNEAQLYPCNNIAVTGNTIIGCENDIVKKINPTNTVCENNIVIPTTA